MSASPDSQSNRKKRSWLFWIFLSIAVPLTVIVLGYASGYSFNTNTQQIVVTSALSVETVPENAEVLLNDNSLGNTPVLQNEIEPGQYTVSLHKDGYYPWKKQLWFGEGKSHIFPAVILFSQSDATAVEDNTIALRSLPETLPDELRDAYIKEGFTQLNQLRIVRGSNDLLIDKPHEVTYILDSIDQFSKDNRIEGSVEDASWNAEDVLAYVTSHELWIYDAASETHTLLTRNSTQLHSVVWHPDGGYILFSADDGIYAIELDGRDYRQIWKLSTVKNAEQLTITKEEPNALYFIQENTIYRLPLYEMP